MKGFAKIIASPLEWLGFLMSGIGVWFSDGNKAQWFNVGCIYPAVETEPAGETDEIPEHPEILVGAVEQPD